MSTSSVMESTVPKDAGDPFQTVELEMRGDIALVRLAPDLPEMEHVVTLTMTRMQSLERVLDDLRTRAGAVRGLVVCGPRADMFAAGADVRAIAQVTDQIQAEELSRVGQAIFNKLEDLPFPKVAAIGGPCLGGGLELVLACDARIAADLPGTRIGLPEVKLGIVPGFGGTFRLPRLIGLPAALDLILTGKMLDPKRARALGLVDRVVPANFLLETAVQKATDLAARGPGRRRPRLPLKTRFLSGPGRALVERAARRKVTAGAARNYPAPARALDLVVHGLGMTRDHALSLEAKALGQLLAGKESRRLVELFLRTEKSKKVHKDFGGGAPVTRAIVVGAGVMGGGIAGVMARKGIAVRVVDVALEPLAKATAAFAADLDKRARRRHMTKAESAAALARWTPSTVMGGLSQIDLVLEAAIEDLGVKQKLFAQVAATLAPKGRDAVLATNTSSLPIDRIADGLPDPSRVVGIHFFNPPDKMPLVEVVRGVRTSDQALALAARLATDLGKFPVVVKDVPGFLVNRCLAPYLEEAARLLIEGIEPEALDRVLTGFGFPMGPARLMDEVGWDVAAKVGEILGAAYPGRMGKSPLAKAMAEAKVLGNKSGGGLYHDDKPFDPGRRVLAQLRAQTGRPTPAFQEAVVLDRCVLPLVAEAARCLDDGIVGSEDELDLAMVMGIGFPPFRGGPIAWAQDVGWKAVVDRLDELARTVGERFVPYDGLRRRAVRVG